MSGYKAGQPTTGEIQATPATSAFSPFRLRIFLAMWVASEIGRRLSTNQQQRVTMTT
jgi:hypothetical protein